MVSFSVDFNLYACLITVLCFPLADPLRVSATTAATDTPDGAVEEDSTEAEDRPSPPLTSSIFTPPATSRPDGSSTFDMPSTSLLGGSPIQPLSGSHLPPTPDFSSQNDSGGPSEPISWAFRRQGLGNPFDFDPPSSPLGPFGEENSSLHHPTSSSPATVWDNQIDPALQSLPAVSTPPDVNPFLVNPAPSEAHLPVMSPTTAHRLTTFSTSRPQFLNAVFSEGSMAVSTPSSRASTAGTLPTPPATSLQRALPSKIILTSLSVPPTSAQAPPTAPLSTPPPAAATVTPLIPTTSPLAPTALDPPRGIQSTSTTHTENSGFLSEIGADERSTERGTQPRARGHGRGGRRGRGGRGRGRRGGRGHQGGTVDEHGPGNASDADIDVNPMRLLSAASRRRITAINKRVYPADGAPVTPLGASLSTNVDGMYPCVTFQAPLPAVAPKKRSWDVVSEADIVAGKRARKERVRQN